MLLSMTGQGQASLDQNGILIHVELRSVNNRYLKVSSRLSDVIGRFEPQVETILRQHLKRGSLQVNIRVQLPPQSDDYRINQVALKSYMEQAQQVAATISPSSILNPGDFINLPGVVESADSIHDEDDPLWEAAGQALAMGATSLNEMRAAEGRSMADQLLKSIDQLESLTSRVRERAPSIVEEYRNRLESKVRKMLTELKIEFQSIDLLREVLLFADKSDIQEEIVRLLSHFQQFRSAIHEKESQGRKLDFLIQELFRETNTIGSKGNDATVSQVIVEMKSIIEQMRELVQNVE